MALLCLLRCASPLARLAGLAPPHAHYCTRTLHTHTARAHCTHTPSALAPPAPTAQVLPFTLRPPPVLQASTPTKAALGLLLCLLLLLHLLSCALCCGGAPKRGRKTREKKLDGQRQQESSK